MADKWKLKQYAKRMRVNPTGGELVMMGRLKMAGLRYKFQKAMGIYIVDFYLFQKNAIVEVDGEYHDDPEQTKKDVRRRKYLMAMGCMVFRCSNEEAGTFDLAPIVALPDATPQEIGRISGRAGSWRIKRKNKRVKMSETPPPQLVTVQAS